MGLPTEYIKETDGKRISRLLQYRIMQHRIVRPIEKTLVLCGPEAGEIGCQRHLLGVEAKDAFFADWKEKDGLKLAKERWPGVNCHFGNVKDVLETERHFSFINLDLMGHLDEARKKLVILAAHCLLPWGFFFYTAFRGREHGHRRRVMLSMSGASTEEKRLKKLAVELRSSLGSRFEPIFSLRYQSNDPFKLTRHSTMTVLGFQKTPAPHPKPKLPMWNEGCSTGALTGEVLGLRKRVTVEAVNLRQEGLKSKQIGEVLNVETGTVAAWLAHSTRGTYKPTGRTQ